MDLSLSKKSYWIVMTKCRITKGGYQTIENQQNKIIELGSEYHFPKVVEAIMWTYLRILKQKPILHNIICQETKPNPYHVLEFYKFRGRAGVAISKPYLDIRIYNGIASKNL